MKAYAIIADASCDLEQELCQKEDIQVVPCHIHMQDSAPALQEDHQQHDQA